MRSPSPYDDRRRRLRTRNAVWTIGPGQWAIGAYKICQQITDTIPKDQEAVWEDADHVRFCIRPHPVIPAMFDENAQMTPQFHTRAVGIYLIGRGVLVKVKHIGEGGSSREAETMKLIRKKTPSVPIPEVLHNWKDPKWFCHVTIMREIPGIELDQVWFALDESQKQRLAEEAANHFRTVAEIQSETAQYANGENLCDGLIVPPLTDRFPGEWGEPEQNPHRFNFKQLNEYRQGHRFPSPLLSEDYGDRFHLCHMDPNPSHFFISDGVTIPPERPYHFFVSDGVTIPYGKRVHSMPLKEQVKLHISGIIDWERAGFFPKCIISWQFHGLLTNGLSHYRYGNPDSSSYEFHNAMKKALIKLGFPDPKKIHIY